MNLSNTVSVATLIEEIQSELKNQLAVGVRFQSY